MSLLKYITDLVKNYISTIQNLKENKRYRMLIHIIGVITVIAMLCNVYRESGWTWGLFWTLFWGSFLTFYFLSRLLHASEFGSCVISFLLTILIIVAIFRFESTRNIWKYVTTGSSESQNESIQNSKVID